MIQQRPQPRSYFGIDLHRGMIKWCQDNLTVNAPHFRFSHFDAYNIGLNPSGSTTPLAFPTTDNTFTLLNAWSVFTHILETDVEFYLREVRRVLTDDAMFVSTWFLMDKVFFPMMQEFQNALYINPVDPTNAAIFDRAWVQEAFAAAGLRIVNVTPPKVRGFAWILIATTRSDLPEAEFPVDSAPFGLRRPPHELKRPASEIGLP